MATTRPKPGDWDYIRPWYVRMWDGPVVGWNIWWLMKCYRTDLGVIGRTSIAMKWLWKYL